MPLADRDYMKKPRTRRGSKGSGRIGTILSWLFWIGLAYAAYYYWFR